MEVTGMKAIIMAGGEGKRLRPVSANKPKPMVELLDRPVLEHILELLVKNDVQEACLTLHYLPQIITEYFGSGEKFGIRLDYRIETEALGTAGGVMSCAEFLGSDDFLVISGDCVCDFDLRALIAFHRQKKADVTLALYACEEPCEYGLVVTDRDGRIEQFVEKPAWDHVLTDRVNTGIYVISPRIFGEIPDGQPYDFGKDLFPRLLLKECRMYGFKAEGYWCDVGSTGAYLKCCLDALQRSVDINMIALEHKKGIWSHAPIPEGVVIIPPVYIGKNAIIDKGATIGPLAVIGASSVIASGAVIANSVINSAVINENVTADGTVICKGSSIGRGTTLCEGSVIGDSCIIGDGCVIAALAKLWPDRQIPAGTVMTGSLSHGMLKSRLVFTKPGVITGELGVAVTAEACLRLGEISGGLNRVGVSWSGGEAARVMAEAFGSGVCATGGELIRYDGRFITCASYAGFLFNLPLSVFIEELKSGMSITFFGKNGGMITHELERKLEMSLADPHETSSRRIGCSSTVSGVYDAFVSAAVKRAFMSVENTGQFTAAVVGSGAENKALKSALLLMDCSISDKKAGIVSFEVKNGGMSLTATDEEGYLLSYEQLLVIVAFIEFASGTRELAVTYDAPGIIDSLAGSFNAAVLRTGRDGQRAEDLLLHQMVMRDGIFAGARLSAWLKSHGEKLSVLRTGMPRFSTMSCEVPLKGSRGSVMRLMSDSCTGMAAEMTAGLRLDTDRGCIYISPLRDRSALKIHAESFSEETAEELCVEFVRRAHEIDK